VNQKNRIQKDKTDEIRNNDKQKSRKKKRIQDPKFIEINNGIFNKTLLQKKKFI
jgi:hypothetical protein